MMQATQLLNQAVALSRTGIATICGDRQRTWGEVGQRVPRLAGALRSLGLGRGDRVAVLAMNSDIYIELFFAIPWAGGACVPLNIRWSTAELAYALDEAGVGVLFHDSGFTAQAHELRQRCRSIRYLVCMDEVSADPHADQRAQPGAQASAALTVQRLIDTHEPVADADMRDEDLYVVFYTGGTTGHPKGVAIPHRSVVYGSMSYLAMLPSIEDIRFLYVGGFFHFSGGSPLWYVTLAGGTHVVPPKFEVVSAMRLIGEHRVTNATLIPTMVNMMMNHPDFARYDLSSMKTCIYGGAPMPEALMQQAMRLLPGWSFYQIYGMTEAGGYATMLRWRDHGFSAHGTSKMRSTGQAAIGVQVAVRGPDGAVAPPGQTGEITVRSGAMMLGYFGDAAATSAAIVDGWLHTGDAGYMDEDGYLFIVDRIKDMIVSGGENVYSVEVERALYAHPAVREAAVIGIPDARWGESVHAVVVFRDGQQASEDELLAHCRALIAGYKCPRSFEFCAEPLPLTHVGKIRKNVLRDPYWQKEATRI